MDYHSISHFDTRGNETSAIYTKKKITRQRWDVSILIEFLLFVSLVLFIWLDVDSVLKIGKGE